MNVKCLLCEKEIVSGEYFLKGGTLIADFGYGSKHDHDAWSWFNDPLTGCHTIESYICDECFEAKKGFFNGYTLEQPKRKLVIKGDKL